MVYDIVLPTLPQRRGNSGAFSALVHHEELPMAQRMPLELYDMWSGYQTRGRPVDPFTAMWWDGVPVTFCWWWWWDGGGMGWDFELQGRVVACFVILHDIFSRSSFPNKLMTIPRGLFQIMSQVFVRHGSLFMASHH